MNNIAIYEENKQQCLVKSCTECCMESIDGKINIRGILHRAQQTVTRESIFGTYSFLDCAHCPVGTEVSDEEWERMLNEIDGTP